MTHVLTAPSHALRPDALVSVRTRRIFALGLDLVLVSVMAAVLWCVLLIATLGLSLFFLPPMWPLVAFFYNGLSVSGAKMATPGMRAMDLEMRMDDIGRARSLHQRRRARAVLLPQLVFPAGVPGVAGGRREAVPARHPRRRRASPGGFEIFLKKIAPGHSRRARSVLAFRIDAKSVRSGKA